MFLLEVQVELIQSFGFLFRDMFEAEFEDLAGSIILTHLDLEFSEIKKVGFI